MSDDLPNFGRPPGAPPTELLQFGVFLQSDGQYRIAIRKPISEATLTIAAAFIRTANPAYWRQLVAEQQEHDVLGRLDRLAPGAGKLLRFDGRN